MVFFSKHQLHRLEMITEHNDPWDNGKEVMKPAHTPLVIPHLKESKLFPDPGDPVVDNVTQLWIPDDEEGQKSLAELRKQWENLPKEERELWKE
jgi:hypothetical protein